MAFVNRGSTEGVADLVVLLCKDTCSSGMPTVWNLRPVSVLGAGGGRSSVVSNMSPEQQPFYSFTNNH